MNLQERMAAGKRILKSGERLDDLERNGFVLIQKTKGFRFGMDAVLLSGFAAVRLGERSMDLGTGTGIIPILLAAKTEGAQFFGLEVQPEAAEMAARSVRLNELCGRVTILLGDLKEILKGQPRFPQADVLPELEPVSAEAATVSAETAEVQGSGACRLSEELAQKFGVGQSPDWTMLTPGSFDVVTSNPPYMKAGQGLKNPNEAKALARHELLCSLSDVCFAAGRLLRSGGRFYMVHRPERLAEILATLAAARLAPKRLRFVHPFADREANMVLVEAVRDGRAGCRIEAPLCIFEAEGQYTEEIRTQYRF